MRCLHAVLLSLLLSACVGFVKCDFWDDLVDAVDEIVDDTFEDEGGLNVEDIVDGARTILDGSNVILPGGNIGGDENSIFDGSFTPVNVGTESDDGDDDDDGSSDVEAFLNQLQEFAGQLGQLVSSDGSLSRDEILDALSTLLSSDSSERDLVVDQDEVFGLLLSAMLDYILEDLGIDVSNEMVDEKLVPLVMDVYDLVKEYSTGLKASSNNSIDDNGGDSDMAVRISQMSFIEDILEEVLEKVFPNLTRKDMLCRAASNGVDRFLDQMSNLEKDAQKTMIKSLSLLVLGCQEGETKEMLLDQTGRLKDMLVSSLNGSLELDNLKYVKSGLSNFPRNYTLSSRHGGQNPNRTRFDDGHLVPWLQRIGSLGPSSNVSRRNRTGTIGDFSRLANPWQPFQGLNKVKTLFDLLAKGDDIHNQTQSTSYTSTLTTTATSKLTTTTTTTKMQPTTATTTQRQRIREFRNDLREAVTNATERLAQLVREEIRSSELAQLIYTLLNSDLARAILQAFNTGTPVIPVQTTVMTIPDITTSTNQSVVFSEGDVRIERISSEDSDPVARAMVQTTIQVIQTANLSDPASIVSTASQILLDNARQTIEDEVLSNPLEFLTSVVDFVSRNDSLLSRFIPEGTMESISEGIGTAVQATQVATSVAGIYSTSGSYGTSQRCTAERGAVGQGITEFQVWALTFLDSIGKLGTGFLQGNTYLEGNYDQCKAIYGETENGDVIEGHYVKFQFSLQITGLNSDASLLSLEEETVTPSIKWYVCLPKGCNADDVTKIGETIAESVGPSIKAEEVTIIEKRDPTSETAFIVAIAVLSALCLLCLAGTAVDIAMREPISDTSDKPEAASGQTKCKPKKRKRKEASASETDEEMRKPTGEKISREASFQNIRADLHNISKAEGQSNTPTAPPSGSATRQEKSNIAKYLIAFSVYTNTSDVMKAEHAPGDLTCLHGIRVFSILWVILGHVYSFMPQLGNLLTLNEMSKWWTLHAILNATYAVDTFFTISGCLVSYLFLRMAEKAGGVKVPHLVMYYVHRYLRLTPLYALAILVYHGLTPYLEEGPFQQDIADRGEDCRDLWWSNLLYISNLRVDLRQCMAWSWYLPNDMQFYAVAPLVLVPLALGYKYLGLLVAFLQVALHLILYAVLVEKYDANLTRNTSEYFRYIYIKPYARCGPYAIGLALGYLLFKTKGKFRIPKVLVGLGWLLAVGGGLTLVYVTHDNLKDFGFMNPTWSDNQMNALDVVGKPLWALCVAWVILACVNGYGGVVNSLLSWAAWIPLSRLTFGAYLIHPMVLMYFNNNRRTLLYFTYHFVIERFLASVLLSFALSYLLSLLIETPVRNIIKPSRKAKPIEPGSKLDPDQDKKLKVLSISSLGKSKAEGSRIRNIYLPDRTESREASFEPTALSSSRTAQSSHPVSARRGLYPIITAFDSTQQAAVPSKGPATRNFGLETLTKTVSFDDEDPTIINPVYASLLDQPNSPTEAQPQRPYLQHQQLELSIFPNIETTSISTSLQNGGKSSRQTFQNETVEINLSPAEDNQHDGQTKEFQVARETESTPLQTIKQEADVKTPPGCDTGDRSNQPPVIDLGYLGIDPFFTIAAPEDLPSNVRTGPEISGSVNEAYAHDHTDDVPVLPSAPPETPSSGRSEKSNKAEAVLA